MQPRNPYICLAIVLILGIVAAGCVVALVTLALSGRETQAVLMATGACVSIISSCVGSLSSFLVNVPRGSVGLANHTNTPRDEPKP